MVSLENISHLTQCTSQSQSKLKKSIETWCVCCKLIKRSCTQLRQHPSPSLLLSVFDFALCKIQRSGNLTVKLLLVNYQYYRVLSHTIDHIVSASSSSTLVPHRINYYHRGRWGNWMKVGHVGAWVQGQSGAQVQGGGNTCCHSNHLTTDGRDVELQLYMARMTSEILLILCNTCAYNLISGWFRQVDFAFATCAV